MKRTAAMLCLMSLLAACSSDAIDLGPARTVPKDKRPTVWGASEKARLGLATMGSTNQSVQQAGGRQVIAQTPTGWEKVPGVRQFRDASWRVRGRTDTDCYLTLGVGGGVEMNMGRWYRNQFGKAAVPAFEALPVIELGERTGRLAQIEGTFSGKPNWMALIAFYNQGQQVTSLKFTGPQDVVKANRQQFLELARSIRVATVGKDPTAPPIRPGDKIPEGHPTVPGPVGVAGKPDPHPGNQASSPYVADVPKGWSPKAGSNRPLHHTFGAAGQVYASSVGGTVQQSFNIWRGEMSQFGQQLGPLTKEQFDALAKVSFFGDDAVLLDVAGDYAGVVGEPIQNARMVIAARQSGASTLFCKMLGPAQDVAANMDKFVQFCGTVRKAQ